MRMPRDEVQTRRPGVHLCPFEVYANIHNYRDQRRTEPHHASGGHKFIYDLKPSILNSLYLSLLVPYEIVIDLLICVVWTKYFSFSTVSYFRGVDCDMAKTWGMVRNFWSHLKAVITNYKYSCGTKVFEFRIGNFFIMLDALFIASRLCVGY